MPVKVTNTALWRHLCHTEVQQTRQAEDNEKPEDKHCEVRIGGQGARWQVEGLGTYWFLFSPRPSTNSRAGPALR